MRCPDCDYPLWNLKARECPECGRAFRPSEFEYVVNSVRFCCPYCDQTYFGTGDNGHLVPPAFDCVSCGRPVTMDEMVLRPAEGVQEMQTRVDHVPWLERSRQGFFRCWIRTVVQSLISPHRLARGLGPEPRAGHAWWFLFFSWTLFVLGGVAAPLLAIALFQAISGDPDAIGLFMVAVGIAVGGGLAMSVYVALWAVSAQLLLRITGGANEPIDRTIESLCYGSGAAAVIAVPCLGPYCGSIVGGVWWIISAILILTGAQRVHGGRASLAVLGLPTLLATVGIALYLWFFLALIPQASTAMVQAAATVQATAETQVLSDAVLAYARDHDGSGPGHAVELLVGDEKIASEVDLVMVASDTLPEGVPVADSNLQELSTAAPRRRGEIVRAAVNALPPDLVAYRVGDFVFTYHGIDLTDADPRLWIVIASPDPGAGPSANVQMLAVGRADGSVLPVASDTLAGALLEQNELRAGLGLPPLPDPATVTHAAPGTAPPPVP
ncbi:MAG: hypothetical protein ACYTJ0_09345 [Planctomycetota bacterium]|jgi:hypothetical protein